MSVEIKMPRLSDTMEQGTLVKWYVKEGDTVEADQVLADIETDKAMMEMPSYDDGVVAKIFTQEGESVSVGTIMLLLAEDGEDASEVIEAVKADGVADAPAEAEAEAESEGDEAEVEEPVAVAAADAPVVASPLVRRLADEHQIDLATLAGSGPGGRIVKRDIVAAINGASKPAAEAPAEPERGTTEAPRQPSPTPTLEPVAEAGPGLGGRVQLSNMRQTIARRLVESKTTVPHFQVTVQIDVEPLIALRKQLNEQLAAQGVKLSVNDFIVRACALAIHQHPIVNGSWQGDAIDIAERVNIGVAIALPEERGGGLVVATLYDADRKGLRQLSAETKELAEKARTRGLTIDEMENSTFTISNLGMFGVDEFNAIINPPNAAILAVSSAIQQPVVKEGELAIGTRMAVTISCDHRIIDGATAAQFLGTVRELLEGPAAILV